MCIEKLITFESKQFKTDPMLKTQIDNYDMILAVENQLDDNPSLWQDVLPIKQTAELLGQKIDALAVQVGIQLINPTGVTMDKEKARLKVEDHAFVISSAVSAYAITNGKDDLYKRTHYPRSAFTRFRDAELQSVGINLWTDCKAVAGELKEYGVSDDDLINFNSDVIAFAAIMKNPVEAIAKRKAATDLIPFLLAEIIAILNDRLDNLMVGLRATQPEFVNVYFNIRAVKSTGSKPLSLTITTLDAVTREPVVHADIEIVGEDIKRVSSKRGYNTVAHLVSGDHELMVSQPNYISKKESFTVVSGETTELVVLLDKK